jgi:hypothetical protein
MSLADVLNDVFNNNDDDMSGLESESDDDGWPDDPADLGGSDDETPK